MATKDFPITACLPVIYTGGDGANPGDKHLPIGKWAAGTGLGWSTRALVKASISFAGMASITAAELRVHMHTAAGFHAHGSGAVNIQTRRKTKDWSESSANTGTGTDEVWGGDSGSLVDSNTADDGDGNSSVSNGAADGAVDTLDITKAVRAWFGGSPNYGLMIQTEGGQADNASAAAEFYSRRQSGEEPVIRITYTTNSPPNAPDNLQPSGGNTIHTGRTITYSGDVDDPDAGDYISAYQIQVYTSGGIAGGQSPIQDYTGNPTGEPKSFSKALTLPDGYFADRSYEWRARTRDRENVWGNWTPARAFRPNTVPDTPPAPNVATDSLAPTIAGEFSDPDPADAPAGVQVEVEAVATSADMWLSGTLPISASPWSTVYGGTPLAWGTAYRARYRCLDDEGGWSAWGAWATFTPTQPIGPDNLTPRTLATKQNSLTPTLTVGHSVTFRNDELEVYAANSLTSTRLWAKPKAGADYAAATSKAYPYAGTALAWGGTYYWRARVEDAASGVDSAWSPLVPFYVNADPSAPANLAARNAAGAPSAVKDGVYLVTVLTPRLEAEYADPDLGPYGDKPTSRTVEVYARNADGSAGALVGSNTLASPPYTVPMAWTYAGTALVVGSSYLVRWRFTDNAGRVGPWSAYMTFRVTTGPAIVLVSPGAGAVVADQTPALAWDYTSSAGKVQATYRVRLFDKGPTAAPFTDEELAHDSGTLAGAAESYQVPPGIVLDDRSYRWDVTVTDTDGLVATLA